MLNFVFENPTKIIFGKGEVSCVGEQMAMLGSKVLLVTGVASSRRTGLYDQVMGKLAEDNIETFSLEGVAPNPEIDMVKQGAKMLRENGIEAVLALGGGSVIDSAKIIAACVDYEGDPWNILQKKHKPKNVAPLGVVLTLAATGSEANGNSVISNPEKEEKRAVYNPGMFPKFSILDPELTYSLPAEQTAYGAVDIMSHVFEQYFHNVSDSEIQDGLAESVMRAVIKYAPMAIAEPDNYEARAALMWASTMALNGVIKAGVLGDWTCHMLGHELSAKYGIAHGAGLAIVFSVWMDVMASKKSKKFKRYAQKVWDIHPSDRSDVEIGKEAVAYTKSFFADILEVGIKLSDYGIDNRRIREMAMQVVDDRGPTNLGGLTPAELEGLLNSAL